jgi:Autotransporter beta-domain
MTRKNKARHGLARSYRIAPTVKMLRAAIVTSVLMTVAGTACAAPLPAFNAGISVYEPNIDVVIDNDYDYTVDASFKAVGISGIASNGDVSINNSGDLNVYADGYYGSSSAYGIFSSAHGDSNVTNSGNINVTAHTSLINFNSAEAQGIKSFAITGDSIVANDGIIHIDVASTGLALAFGINAYSGYGDVNVQNTGDIYIAADAGGTVIAAGIEVGSRTGNGVVNNSGGIIINAESESWASLHGIKTYSSGGGFDIVNVGDIALSTVADSDADAAAIFTQSFSGNASIETLVENAGDLTVTANSIYGKSSVRGISTYGQNSSISIENAGDINLVSEADHGYANAFGILTGGAYAADVFNSGDIDINVSANVAEYNYSQSLAFGIYSQGVFSLIENVGDIVITANSGNGSLHAKGIAADGVWADVQNSGSITIDAYSETDQVDASGIDIVSLYDAIVYNSGDISVSAESGSGIAQAVGIHIYSQDGTISLNNTGNITATSESGIAYAVSLSGYYGASFTNSGDIQAFGDGALAIISVNEVFTNAGTVIQNEGNIHGGIRTGLSDDLLRNKTSGSIFLDDSTIDLGDGENAFINEGELFANGDANFIGIGAGNLFTNNGNSIHMNDGAADDSLTIAGDFNGTGGVFVDVDGASLTADSLFIDGNVLAGTANTITINMVSPVGLSDIADGTEIAIVSVTGTSQAGNFILNPISGAVSGLYTFDYSLNYNQGDYSLAFDIGMSGLGTLATTLSPAIQSIWYNSIGTVYQREGSARSFLGKGEDSGGGVWARVYGTDGSYVPDASKNNFDGTAGANFDMSGIALDAGVGYAFNEQFVVGAILGTSDTDVTPESGGEATVSAISIGAYVSYLPGNGFYGDLYYRWMDFDGDGTFGGDRIDYQGNAYGFSFEFGYAFQTASGFKIEPQLQYSDMKVDMDNIIYSNTDFQLNDGDSSQLRAGLALSKDYTAGWGKWTPYGALSYVDLSGGGNDYDISGVLEGSVDMSGSSSLLEVGLTATAGEWIFAGGLNWQDGGAFDSVLSGQLNVKYIW